MIRDFNNYLNQLDEVLKNPIAVNWSQKDIDSWIGDFNINNIEYEITIENISKKQKLFLFKFTANRSYKLVNDIKSSLITIPTVENAAKKFINDTNPDAFLFFALDESRSRKRFYTDFCQKYKNGYEFKEFTLGMYHFYVLFNDKVDNKDFNDSINKIIK